ncbi:NUDIX domain-containing protein [Glutamicibacter sp. JL.03c]|uniref:NUDIX domain-containing protein n=1 Tax=Glutamicibacter sp. JL.03c TaxID=2984842 RepID=UPI0021F7455E|nr:NUDIX domain-containing protein [Glutamicibacter sp. JL.03c]UYQ76244.1 NUDIX domain-containing protein [Glutamicibacter sp. JL.03c]
MTAISYVVLRRGEEVLLQLRRGTGFMDGCWSIAAAGRVESGESSAAAAVREAGEELGIRIAAKDLEELFTESRTNSIPGAGDIDDHFHLATAWCGTPRIMEPDKAGDLRWFGLGELPENLVPHEKVVLLKLPTG